MNALTRTGTTVKSFKTDDKSVKLGNSFGFIKPPLKNFVATIAPVMTRKRTARASDVADANLKSSAMKHKSITFNSKRSKQHIVLLY